MRPIEFCGDVAGVLAFGLLLPVAILVVGTPVVLGVKLLLALFRL
jgi:hypothetical protein